MNTKLFVLSLSLLAAPVLTAQEAPTPSPKLKNFERMLGDWVGKGTYTRPETGTQPWSGKIRCEKTLNGFFIKDRTEIDVGAGSPAIFDEYYGMDPATDRPVRIAVGNMGDPVRTAQMIWLDKDTLVETHAGVQGEMPYVQRVIWSFGKDSYKFVEQFAMGDGPFETVIEGKFEKAEKPVVFSDETRFLMGPPPAAEMGDLRKLAGEYATKGWYEMDVPGGQVVKMNLTGVDTIQSRFGGHAMEFRTIGSSDAQPDEQYESMMFVTWDPAKKHFSCVSMDNMGFLTEMELHRAGENSWSMHAMHPWMGQPMMGRSVMTVGENGPTVMEGHTMYGAEKPKHSFHMTYKRAD